jgi:hypothetical protein
MANDRRPAPHNPQEIEYDFIVGKGEEHVQESAQ